MKLGLKSDSFFLFFYNSLEKCVTDYVLYDMMDDNSEDMCFCILYCQKFSKLEVMVIGF